MYEPRPVTGNPRSNHYIPTCAKLMTMAEQELSTFTNAVKQLFGAEQAALAAEDWINELHSMDFLPGLTHRAWRVVTIAASARLAGRVNKEWRQHPLSSQIDARCA